MSWFKDAYKWIKKVSGSGDTVADQVNNELPSNFGSDNSWNSGESKASTDTQDQGSLGPLEYAYWSLVFTDIYNGKNPFVNKRMNSGANVGTDYGLVVGVVVLFVVWLFFSDE